MIVQWSFNSRQAELADFSDSDDGETSTSVAATSSDKSDGATHDADLLDDLNVDEGDVNFVESPFTIAQRRAAQRKRSKQAARTSEKPNEQLNGPSAAPSLSSTSAYKQPARLGGSLATVSPAYTKSTSSLSSPASDETSSASISASFLTPPSSIDNGNRAPFSQKGPVPAMLNQRRSHRERPGLLPARVAVKTHAQQPAAATPGQTTLCFSQRLPPVGEQAALTELNTGSWQNPSFDQSASVPQPRPSNPAASSIQQQQYQQPATSDGFDAFFCDDESLQIWKDVVTPPAEDHNRSNCRSAGDPYVETRHRSDSKEARRDKERQQRQWMRQSVHTEEVPDHNSVVKAGHHLHPPMAPEMRLRPHLPAPQALIQTDLPPNGTAAGEVDDDAPFAFDADRQAAIVVPSSSSPYIVNDHVYATPEQQSHQRARFASSWQYQADHQSPGTSSQHIASSINTPYIHGQRFTFSSSPIRSWHVYQNSGSNVQPNSHSSPSVGDGRQKLSHFAFGDNACSGSSSSSSGYHLPSLDPSITASRSVRGSAKGRKTYPRLSAANGFQPEPIAHSSAHRRPSSAFNGGSIRAGLSAAARRATVKRFDIPYLGSSSLSARARLATANRVATVHEISDDEEDVGTTSGRASQMFSSPQQHEPGKHRYTLKRLPPDVNVEVHEWEEEEEEGEGRVQEKRKKTRLTLFKPSAPREGL